MLLAIRMKFEAQPRSPRLEIQLEEVTTDEAHYPSPIPSPARARIRRYDPSFVCPVNPIAHSRAGTYPGPNPDPATACLQTSRNCGTRHASAHREGEGR